MSESHTEFVSTMSVNVGASLPVLISIAVVGLLIIGGWLLLATSRFLQGGNVERPERVPQLYGYTVCLVTILVAFAAVVSVADALITLANPAHPRNDMAAWAEPSVTSFEAFRVSSERLRMMNGPQAPAPEPVAEDELRRRYEALRSDRIARTRVDATRTLLRSGFTLIVAGLLFLWHWRWLKRRIEPDAGRFAPAQ